jgi:hypothetical protein
LLLASFTPGKRVPLRITGIIRAAGILMQNLEHMGVKPGVFRARYTDSTLAIMG